LIANGIAFFCSNDDSCNVNTILWNTIQLLFPQDVKERKATNFFNSQQQPNGASSSGLMSSRRNDTTTSMANNVIVTPEDIEVENMRDNIVLDDIVMNLLENLSGRLV
jgi:hypothetical protein